MNSWKTRKTNKLWESGNRAVAVEKYKDVIIIWQIDNAEQEYKRVIGDKYRGKTKINKIANKKIQEFKGSDFWKRIRNPILEKQKELENKS